MARPDPTPQPTSSLPPGGITSAGRRRAKLDATADRKSSVFRVHAVHQDVPFDKTMTRAVDAEIEALASWLGLAEISRLGS